MQREGMIGEVKQYFVSFKFIFEKCENVYGDYLLFKFLKNKVDYCWFYGIEFYYIMDMFNEKMVGWWVKFFVIYMFMFVSLSGFCGWIVMLFL